MRTQSYNTKDTKDTKDKKEREREKKMGKNDTNGKKNLRPEIADEKLSVSVNKAFDKLEAYFPEHKVFSFDSIDETLREKMSKLCKELGYSTMDDMFSAYGFEIISGNAVKELRSTVMYTPGNEPDIIKSKVESMLRRLAEYYPDHIITRGMQNDHKNLASAISGLYQWLGYPDAGSMLEAYGYKYNINKSGRPKQDLQPIIDALSEKYKDIPKPNNMTEILRDNPELKGPLKTLSNQSKEVYGMTLKKYFEKIGIIATKKDDYDKALSLLNDGNITEAYETLIGLKGYKDSAEKANAIVEKYNDAKYGDDYNKALSLLNEGNVIEAYETLISLKGYKDSAEKAKAIAEKYYDTKKDDDYDKALSLLNEGNVIEAYETLISLDGYKDSAEKAEEIYKKNQLKKLKKAKIGDCIFFGKYPQDKMGKKKEDIEWLVMDKDDNKILVISKHGLDYQKYNNRSSRTTWKTCSLRKWLNKTFLNEAFDPVEQMQILNSVVTVDVNPEYNTPPGNDTKDKIFLLSITEANKYFKSNEVRQCTLTDYAIAQSAYRSSSNSTGGKDAFAWWLRSPGREKDYATFVDDNDSVNYDGFYVTEDNMVRPVMWINFKNQNERYNEAVSLLSSNNIIKAYEMLISLDDYKDSSEKANEIYKKYQLKKIEEAKIGDHIPFGKFPQNKEEKETIEWLVLDEDDYKILVISKYCLDSQEYNNKQTTSLTWEKCALRRWLNKTFLNEAFDSHEQKLILCSTVTADNNPEYGTRIGNDTTDKIFLLSIPEAEKYFDSDEARMCKGTAYCNIVAWERREHLTWWLRSPGSGSNFAAYIRANGSVDYSGFYFDINNTFRPAMWISRKKQNKLYKDAVSLLNDGKNVKAYEILIGLDGYKDSTKIFNDAKYDEAISLLNEGNVIDAYETLIGLVGYKDSKKKAKEIYDTYKDAKLMKADIGDHIFFGRYPQDRAGKKKKDIEWLVLDKDGDKKLIISRYALDCQPYTTSWENITWESCTLRKWLNETFINDAFNSNEQEKIIYATINAEQNTKEYKFCKETRDKVFLLSITEEKEYLKSDDERICEGTPYCFAQGANKERSHNFCYWWLRTIDKKYEKPVRIENSGDAEVGLLFGWGNKIAVRPALWIDTGDRDRKYGEDYDKALSLLNDGNITEAYEALNSLDGYKDSKEKADEIYNDIKYGEKYNEAVSFVSHGNIIKAYETLISLDGYKDCKEKADEIFDRYNDAKYGPDYDKALALLNDGNVVDAYETLIGLDGYKDSKEKADDIYEEYITAKLKNAEIGDYVFFGAYEQDNIKGNGKEKIEWLVLARNNDKMLVISRYALDCKPYNTDYKAVTWETCSLHKWLNETFFNEAFDSDEQKLILSSTVTADPNPHYDTPPGNDTTDKVFLLSITEVNKYFKSDDARKCAPTDYAIAQGAYTSSRYSTGGRATCWWWLRSPGHDSNTAAFVYDDGSVYHLGNRVDSSDLAVRPVLWIKIESE